MLSAKVKDREGDAINGWVPHGKGSMKWADGS